MKNSLMNVGQLIEQLQKFDKQMSVRMEAGDYETNCFPVKRIQEEDIYEDQDEIGGENEKSEKVVLVCYGMND